MKIASKILSGIFVLVLCFVVLPVNISGQVSAASLGETISITYDFPEPRIEQAWNIPPVKGSGGYVSVTMEGLPQWSDPGLPVLPFRTARILLPYGTEVQDVTVTCGNKVALPGSYLVQPGQEAVPLSYEGLVEPTPPDSEVYDSSDPFPGKLYSDAIVQSKTGYRILLVNLHPVEYIPKPGQLSYCESMTVKVVVGAAVEGEWLLIQGQPQGEEVVRNMVDNPEVTSSYSASPISSERGFLLDPGDYGYVIITNEALEATPGPNNFQALRDNKISRGITATIVTTEWIYANYSGSRPDGGEDSQTRIRNFIIDAYNTWGTTYVLLGGDGDGADVGGESGDAIIPHRGFASVSGEIDYDIPADMYYACLDGTFDYDADGIYGEPNDGPGGGEVDLFAEVYVGRAPVDSETEIANFVIKTLAYQNTAQDDENIRNVWMVGEYLGFGGVAEWGGNYKDEIKEGSDAHGYTTVGFEDSCYAPCFDVSTLYDRDYPGNNWPTSEIISIINGNAHLINHLGHAGVGYVMKMSNSDVDGLTNDELYFIGYSWGCYCGAFDNRTSGGTYTDYDCISEHLTTEAHGAAAFIASSRYGWGSWFSTDGPSQHYDREFWDAVLGEHIQNIGIANQDSKEDNAGRISYSYDRWCYYEINLFGDPELGVKLPEAVLHESHVIDDGTGGDGDGYPEPGESIRMPVTLRNTSGDTAFTDVTATLSANTVLSTTIFSDDFEGTWPGSWIVGDSEPDSGLDYWGQSGYGAFAGDYSAYCAEVSDVSGQSYDNDMAAYMYQDVDLSTYDSATLSYRYWLSCEVYYDHVDIGYYDGSWHWVQSHTGSSGGWVSDSVAIPATATAVGFQFYSDYSITYEGAYIDDVALTGYSLTADTYITITDDYEEYGDIPPGGTAVSLDAYDFDIDPGCPDGHEVIFNLDITAGNGGPWTDSFSVTVEEMVPMSDIVQVTNDPGVDYAPAITQTDDGKVWVVWNSYRSGNGDIWYKTSDDGGLTWSPASQITTDPDEDYYPAIAQTDDGRVWVVWFSYRSGNADIWYKTSSDGGLTWSPASQITTDPDGDYSPAIAQTDDGKVWMVWHSGRSGNADIWCKTSSDGGATWAPASQITTDPGEDYAPAIAQTDDGKVWVVWERYGDIWYKTSDDGGATWAPASQITTDPGEDYAPAIAQTDDGKVWVVWCSYRLGNADIWYKTSSDGGATWSSASQFTQFVGYDDFPGAAALSSGELALAWFSDRYSDYDIWYGVIGSMQDINPPPYLYWAENDPWRPEPDDTVTVRASAIDESGVQDVQLVWLVNGMPQVNLAMYDDGAHDDGAAGDGVYGVQIGPFPVDTVVEYRFQITDIDDNTIVSPYTQSFVVIAPWEKTADIVVVEDGSSSFVEYYTDTLDTLGYAYDYWDDDVRGNIDAETLDLYTDGIVIWAVPSFGYIMNSETQDNLASYLDNGGKLFISGQDIGIQIGYSEFYRDYLHAEYVQDDIDLYGLFGEDADPITDGLYVSISGSDGANNQYSPSEINPISPAVTIFTYDPGATTSLVEPSIPEEVGVRPESDAMLPDPETTPRRGQTPPNASPGEREPGTKVIQSSGSGALRVDTGTYKVVYFAFGFEAINSAADRALVMDRVLSWLMVPMSDIVQVTTDPGLDYYPAITQTDDGKVWVVWCSYRSGNGDIWYKTSDDGGLTWSPPSQITTDPGEDYVPAIAQTDDGKVWVVWFSYRSGNADIWYKTSGDGGLTWSPPSQITTDAGSDYSPAITQTDNGKVWVAWYSYRSGNADIWYKTSKDGGATWAPASQITTDLGGDYAPAIARTDDGKVWVVWYSSRSGNSDIWYKTSSDGGATWSPASQITTDLSWNYSPAIAQTADGKVWVVWCSYRSGNVDIWFKTSSDGGASWSPASQFTQFVGYDDFPGAAALSSGELALAWASDRYFTYNIWYGVIGSMQDINPPPYLYWAENDPSYPEPDDTVTVRASAIDESGVEDVQLVWWVNGTPEVNLAMYDDGAHDDYNAGDGVYGVQIGPFPVEGTVVEYRFQITDIDDNTIVSPYTQSFVVIAPWEKTADIVVVGDYAGSLVGYYTDTLDTLGYAYDYWDGDLRGNIDAETLDLYTDGIVIWAVPYSGSIGYSETQDNLASYLDNGGKLFISGQDIGYYIGYSDFYRDYLHAEYVQDDIDLYGLFGEDADPITDGLYVSISGGDGANNQVWPSEIDPISPAVTIFTYDPGATTSLVEPSIPEEEGVRPESDAMLPDLELTPRHGQTPPNASPGEREPGTKVIQSSGSGALRVDTGTYKVVYFAFGFEAINSAADRALVMDRVLSWLSVPVWSVPMIAITPTEGSNPNLEFGTDISATDGYDSGIDAPHPPSGPGATFDAYFEIDDPLFPQLDKDYRGPADTIGGGGCGAAPSQWTLHVESTSEPITILWDAGGIPAGLFVYMDTGISVIDMKAESFTTLLPGEYSIAISVGVEVEITLKAGWNMVSVPVTPGDPSVGSVFAGAEVVYTWDPISKSYYSPTEVEPSKGYWVAVIQDTVIQVRGVPVCCGTIDITAGWNMIGSLMEDVDFTDPQDDPDGSVEAFAYWWNPVTKSYDFTTTIESTKGYWVAATQDCTLTLCVIAIPSFTWEYLVDYDDGAGYTEVDHPFTLTLTELNVTPPDFICVPAAEQISCNLYEIDTHPDGCCPPNPTKPKRPLSGFTIIPMSVQVWRNAANGTAVAIHAPVCMTAPLPLGLVNGEGINTDYTAVSGTVGRPYALGDNWTYNYTSNAEILGDCIGETSTVTRTVEVVAVDVSVTVPAGTFDDCVQLVETTEGGTGSITTWWSPTVQNMVKSVDDMSYAPGVEIWELASYYPQIWYNPTSFTFNATEGDPILTDTLWIRNDGDDTLNWTVSDDAAWLSLDPTSGSSTGEMDDVTLSVDITGMVAGSYSATITIEAPGATNTPQTVPVSLSITPSAVSLLSLPSLLETNEVWSVPMTASTATEGSNSSLEFGTNTSATDGYDSEIDIPQPPQGPGATFDAYFEITDPLFPQLYKDYRGPSDGIEWTLHVESNSEVITLTWDVTSVPEDVSLHMNNGGLDIDMKAVNSTSLAAVSLIIHTGGGGGRGGGGGGGGGLSSPTEPTKPLEEPEEPAEPVVPEPKPTPTPSAPPPALEELGGPSGLAPGAWVGIGIGTALLLALVVWLILRRWVWAAAHREDS